jgi:glycosyltransferase involved in cell wall biosynthesis
MREVVHLGKSYFPDFGGIETATKNLAEVGVELGFDVTCDIAGAKACWPKRYVINGVKIKRRLTLGRLLSTPLAPGLLRLNKKGALIHVHLPNPLGELAILAHSAVFGRASRSWPFFHALPFKGKGLGGLWFRFVTKRVLARAEHILVSSPYVVQAFPELSVFGDKIKVMPFVTEVSSREAISSLWPKREQEKTVITIGRLVPYKGHLGLVEAWRISRLAERGYKLRIIGDGPLYAALQGAVAGDRSITLQRGCTEVEKVEWLERACAFVLPSVDESETFGIAAQEAMARGLPLVLTDLPTGVKELAREGRCGAIARAGDVNSLAEALNSLLLCREADLPQIGEGNRAFVGGRFSPAVLREEYRRLL